MLSFSTSSLNGHTESNNMFNNYIKDLIKQEPDEDVESKYKAKVTRLKQQINEYVHENAALLDEIEEVQMNIIIRKEERKFLLRKLCQYEPHTEVEVQAAAKTGFSTSQNVSPHDSKKIRKRTHLESTERNKPQRVRKSLSSKVRKKVVQQIPLDATGRPVFPIELGNLTIHSLGEVIYDKSEFHCDEAIYPVGYVSTRLYGSLRDPTVKCIYTCKISDANGVPRFEIAADDNCPSIVGGTPDVCHSMLLQKINDVLSLHVVSTRPRGNDFFGLTHPTVLNLIQSSPGTRKCINYKWSKFEVSKNGDRYCEDADAALSFESLQKNIDYRKYKMASDSMPPSSGYYDTNTNVREYLN